MLKHYSAQSVSHDRNQQSRQAGRSPPGEKCRPHRGTFFRLRPRGKCVVPITSPLLWNSFSASKCHRTLFVSPCLATSFCNSFHSFIVFGSLTNIGLSRLAFQTAPRRQTVHLQTVCLGPCVGNTGNALDACISGFRSKFNVAHLPRPAGVSASLRQATSTAAQNKQLRGHTPGLPKRLL